MTKAAYERSIDEMARRLSEAEQLDFRDDVTLGMKRRLKELRQNYNAFLDRTMRRQSPVMMGVGYGLIALGGGAFLSAFMFGGPFVPVGCHNGDPDGCDAPIISADGVYALIIGGAVVAVMGIPCVVIGKRKVPIDNFYTEEIPYVSVVASPIAIAEASGSRIMGVALFGSF